MALDALSEVLNTDSCWIQWFGEDNSKLPLAACCGFTLEMRQGMASVNLEHRFGKEIAGLGHKILIPDLGRDGKYDIPVFERSGYSSLAAVPIMTYRIHGILGIAYRNKTSFSKDFAGLLAVIAGLIGMALNKSLLINNMARQEKPLTVSEEMLQAGLGENGGDDEKPVLSEPAGSVTIWDSNPDRAEKDNGRFHEHVRRMVDFRKYHQS